MNYPLKRGKVYHPFEEKFDPLKEAPEFIQGDNYSMYIEELQEEYPVDHQRYILIPVKDVKNKLNNIAASSAYADSARKKQWETNEKLLREFIESEEE